MSGLLVGFYGRLVQNRIASGHPKSALRMARAGVRVFRKNHASWLLLSNTIRDTGGSDSEVEEVLRWGLDVLPDSIDLGVALHAEITQVERLPEKQELLEKLAQRHPHAAEVKSALGYEALSYGDQARARAFFDEAFRLLPQRYSALTECEIASGYLLIPEAKHTGLAILEGLVARQVRLPQAYVMLAIETERANPPRAADLMRQARELRGPLPGFDEWVRSVREALRKSKE
jgi:tetratricopeptide (TPR) repeat protein